jgi:hypothetical protein
LSDLDLVALREQLYILDTEAGHLRTEPSSSSATGHLLSSRSAAKRPS